MIPRIVAEIGTSHKGDLTHAKELIHAAKEAGADVVKSQMVIASEILHPRSGLTALPGGTTALYERFLALERDKTFYQNLIDICSTLDIHFLCTPFGIKSAQILQQLGINEIKIASPELNHVVLLQEIATYGKPVILSTGIATIADIHEALQYIKRLPNVSLLHCITAYPAPENEYNLRVIPSLRQVFGVNVGISDHSTDPVLVPALATLQEAHMIEKHITLSRKNTGLDDAIALEPSEFAQMVTAVRKTADMHNDSEIRKEYGSKRVDAVLGNGIKHLAESEMRNYRFTNRSIHAVTDIHTGEVLSHKNMAILRSERNLRPGIHPRYWNILIGTKTQQYIQAGDGIVWENLLCT